MTKKKYQSQEQPKPTKVGPEDNAPHMDPATLAQIHSDVAEIEQRKAESEEAIQAAAQSREPSPEVLEWNRQRLEKERAELAFADSQVINAAVAFIAAVRRKRDHWEDPYTCDEGAHSFREWCVMKFGDRLGVFLDEML